MQKIRGQGKFWRYQLHASANAETKLAWNFAIDQRKIACDLQCPLVNIARQCGLTRAPNQSDEDYVEMCTAVIREG